MATRDRRPRASTSPRSPRVVWDCRSSACAAPRGGEDGSSAPQSRASTSTSMSASTPVWHSAPVRSARPPRAPRSWLGAPPPARAQERRRWRTAQGKRSAKRAGGSSRRATRRPGHRSARRREPGLPGSGNMYTARTCHSAAARRASTPRHHRPMRVQVTAAQQASQVSSSATSC